MENLLNTIKKTINEKRERPFAVYTSIKEQNLLNVPIVKPLLIVVLSGSKELGKDNELNCHSGDFIFLSDTPAINMRNIPRDKEYFALLIEFDFQDFNGLQINAFNKQRFCIGKTTPPLEKCLQQFVESSVWAPKQLWSLRKREILALLCHMGHKEIFSMLGNSKIGYQLHAMFCEQGFHDLSIEHICKSMAMSESTLRTTMSLT